MVTKRTPLQRDSKIKITPQLLDAYARVKEMWEAYQDESDEWSDATRKLHQLLGLPPWAEAVQHCLNEDEPPKWMVDLHRVNEWKKTHAIRVQLDEALEQRGK